MECNHQFHKIKEETRAPKAKPEKTMSTTGGDVIAQRWDDEAGARVGCALCGEIRVIWEDGSIEKLNEASSDTKG